MIKKSNVHPIIDTDDFVLELIETEDNGFYIRASEFENYHWKGEVLLNKADFLNLIKDAMQEEER